MRLIFIHGPAAAGKYTLAKGVAEALGLPLFHNHLTVDLVLSLFEFGTPSFVKLRERIWLESFSAAARESCSFVFTFHPEASVDPGFIGRAIRTVEEQGGEVTFVELTCPESIVEERLPLESRAAFGKLRSVELYRQLRDQGAFEFPPLPPPLLRLATDELSPEESVAKIVEAVQRLGES